MNVSDTCYSHKAIDSHCSVVSTGWKLGLVSIRKEWEIPTPFWRSIVVVQDLWWWIFGPFPGPLGCGCSILEVPCLEWLKVAKEMQQRPLLQSENQWNATHFTLVPSWQGTLNGSWSWFWVVWVVWVLGCLCPWILEFSSHPSAWRKTWTRKPKRTTETSGLIFQILPSPLRCTVGYANRHS